MSKYYISLSKSYNNSHTMWWNHGKRGAKPKLKAFYIDENGKFGSEMVSLLHSVWIRANLWKRKKFVCLSCECESVVLVKKDLDFVECSYCNNGGLDEHNSDDASDIS